MPLSIEGQVMSALRQRQDDQAFIAQYGEARFQQKLTQEGLYGYGFSSEQLHHQAVDLVISLSQEILQGDDLTEKARYFGGPKGERWFKYESWYSTMPQVEQVLLVCKPFPHDRFVSHLREQQIQYIPISVYRLGDLTEDEIRLRKSGGLLLTSTYYVDLSGTITRGRQEKGEKRR